MKVLLVEDNPVLRDRIARQFLKSVVIEVAGSGEQALTKVMDDYTVIILDLGLPDMPGIKVCETLRGAGIETPILVLTAEAEVESRVALLNAGADDYLIKPFHGDELRARVLALARRKPKRLLRELIEIGGLKLNRESRTVERDGRSIYLTRKEFDILEYLALNKGRVMTREMIFDRVWSNDSNALNNVVDVHIKRLRDKVDRPFATTLIHTAHGLGYVVNERGRMQHVAGPSYDL